MIDRATLGGGCFWCLEAVFQELAGVQSVTSGYTGGPTESPTYEQVCSGTSGHAEVCQIEFDTDALSFTQLLEVFFRVHDPTTLNRQGNDVGTQYRSVVFWHHSDQEQMSREVITALDQSGSWDSPLVTQLEKLEAFYPAEEYHQDYFRRNPQQGYCSAVVAPKVARFRQAFSGLLANGIRT